MRDDKRLDPPRYSVKSCQLPLLDGHTHKNSKSTQAPTSTECQPNRYFQHHSLPFSLSYLYRAATGDTMPLSTFISRPWQPRNVFSQRLATTRRFLDKHHKSTSLPTAFLCSETTLDASAANPSSKTFECSEEGWSNAQLRPVLSLAATPTNSSRHSLDDGENAAPKGQAFAVDKLKERLARIVARMERSHQQPPHQQQPFIRAPPNRIWSLILRLSHHPRPDDDSGACYRSPEDPTPLRAAPEIPPICGLARQPSLGGNSDPQDRQHDTGIETTVESDSDSDTAVEGDSDSDTAVEYDVDTDDDNLCQPLLETLHRRHPKDEIRELMKAIFVHQLVNKTRIDPLRELKRAGRLGIQRYAWKLAEDIGKQLALEVAGLSTEAILDTALNQHQTWARPSRSIEQPRIFRRDLDQANKALKECEQHRRGILSWLYLLRLQAQMDMLPNFHSFPASSRDAQRALARVFRDCTVTTTADRVILDPELLMAAALRHRALINARQRLGYSIDAKVYHDCLNLRARRPDLRIRWLIGETERLLGSHVPSSLGDTERMEQCRNALKLKPFALLRARYPDVKAKFKHEYAIGILQHEPVFQTDFVGSGHDRGVYLYYCTLVLASYGFEPPRSLDIELDYLLALILQEMKRREKVTLCLMRLCKGRCWLPKNGPSLCWQGTIN